MNQNWRTNLGGAIGVLGTSLAGIGIVPSLANGPTKVLLWLTVIGFVLIGVGKAVTALFAADAKTMNQLTAANSADIAQLKSDVKTTATEAAKAVSTGDTEQLKRVAAALPTKPISG